MEHTVRSRKELIRALGANKTQQAMLQSTAALESIDELTKQFDVEEMASTLSKSSYTKASTKSDRLKIRQRLLNLKPFKETLGREVPGVQKVQTTSPFESINRESMRIFIANKIEHLLDGTGVFVEADDSDGYESDEGLPAI